MRMRPEPEMIPVLIDAAKALKGSQRRLFMAKTVKAMGRGGQRRAMEHLTHVQSSDRTGGTASLTFQLRRGHPLGQVPLELFVDMVDDRPMQRLLVPLQRQDVIRAPLDDLLGDRLLRAH